MTIKEVKMGLKCCAAEKCEQCPYRVTRTRCVDALIRDASQTIRMLEAEIAEINAQAVNGVREEGTEEAPNV